MAAALPRRRCAAAPRSSVQAVGAITRLMPSSVQALNDRRQIAISSSIVKPTCDRPTTETRAGGPAAKAFVNRSWPLVAQTPMPSSIAIVRGSQRRGSACCRGKTNSAATQQASATPEKWATTARGSSSRTWCRPISATALVNELTRAAATAMCPPAELAAAGSARRRRRPSATAGQTSNGGHSPRSGSDSTATHSGNMFVSVSTSETG